MRPIHSRFLFFAVLLPMLLSVTPTAFVCAQTPEGRVATVNGTEITRNDFEIQLLQAQLINQQRGNPLNEKQLAQLKKQILDSLVSQELLFQSAQKAGIQIEESQLNQHMESFKKRFANAQAFQSALKQRGLDETSLSALYAKALTIRELINIQVVPGISVSKEEQKAYYDAHPEQFQLPDRIRASHILVKVPSDADEATRKAGREKIEKIATELKNGGNFAALAKEHSDDGSAARGGDLGYFTRGKMVKPFEEAAFALKIGETSPVVQTQFGYHLIYVVDRQNAGMASFEKAQNWIAERVTQGKVEEAVKAKIDALKKEADIQIF